MENGTMASMTSFPNVTRSTLSMKLLCSSSSCKYVGQVRDLFLLMLMDIPKWPDIKVSTIVG